MKIIKEVSPTLVSPVMATSLASLVKRGGVYHNVPGTKPDEFITNVIKLLPPVPSLDAINLVNEIMEREALVSTGVGRGIALPHPRNPALSSADGTGAADPLVAIIFPAQPLDWNTPDGSKVHTFFLILSSSAKQHLGTLSKINFLCHQEKFYSLLKTRASGETIINAIGEAEAAWEK